MKILFFSFVFFILITHSVFSQIPNNGFENWTDMGSYSIPDSWGNLNAVTNPGGVYTCSKGTPGNPGSAYLKLISRTVTGMGVQPGIAVSGVMNTTTFQAVSGFAYADRPVSLDGSWQYMAGGADQGFISVFLTKWNSTLLLRDTIGQCTYPLPGMVMTWRNFSLPITYGNPDKPDSAVILLSASGKTPVSGSYLYVDNLSFTGGTAGLDNKTASSELQVFPNPATQNVLMIDIKDHEKTVNFIEILDIKGNQILRKDINERFPVFMDISSLHSGEYFLRVGSSIGTFVSRFIRK